MDGRFTSEALGIVIGEDEFAAVGPVRPGNEERPA